MEVKTNLKTLKKEKNIIKNLIVKEKEKRKVDSEIEETFFSRISSIKLASQKSRTSLDKFGSSITTISPRSPKSKTIIEENLGVTNEHFSFHKGCSKSLTLPDKVAELKINTQQKIDSYDNVSPDFKRVDMFEDRKVKRKEISQQNNLNDSLFEEINQQTPQSNCSKITLNKNELSNLVRDIPKKKNIQIEASRECDFMKPHKDDKNLNKFISTYQISSPSKKKEGNQIEKNHSNHLSSISIKLKNRF